MQLMTLPASVHARLAECARREGVSLNALLNAFAVEGLAGRSIEERLSRLENRFEEIESGSDVMTGRRREFDRGHGCQLSSIEEFASTY